MKLMIATPAQNGLVDIEYAYSFAKTLHECAMQKLPVQVVIKRSGSLIISERNKILNDFRKSDCTHLMCVDADIGWNSADIFNLLAKGKDIIGACYLSRGEKGYIFRPFFKDHLEIDAKGLIMMTAIPAGFLMISKKALEIMVARFPELYYSAKEGDEEGYGFFNTMVRDGEYWGEDFSFCLRAIDAGLHIWVDPTIELFHAGQKGKLMDALKMAENGEEYECVMAE